MEAISKTTFVRVLSLSLLVSAGLAIIGCDSGGANGGTEGPFPPTVMSGITGDKIVHLQWSTHDREEVEAYNVYRSTSSIEEGSISELEPRNESPLSENSYEEDGLTAGTNYHYAVTAVSGNGNEGPPSQNVQLVPKEILDCGNGGSTGKIIFASDRNGNDKGIYKVNTSGSGVQQITGNSADDYHPDFSSNGSRIVFVSDRDRDKGEIYTMKSDGTDLIRVTDNFVSESEPTWSSDGSRIAFQRDRNIYTIKPDGSDLKQVTTDGGFDPTWSPDGSRIAFTVAGDQLRTIKTDGTDRKTLIDHSGSDPPIRIGSPDWSPDGSRIVFSSERDDEDGEIYTVKPDGSDRTQITDFNPDLYGQSSYYSPDRAPAWSPDGSKIVFETSRGLFSPTQADIYTLTPGGSTVNRVTCTTDMNEVAPSWGP